MMEDTKTTIIKEEQPSTTTTATTSSKSRGWPKGRKRFPKLSGAPKQPLSAYVHFLNEKRVLLKQQEPELSFAQISRKLAADWACLGSEAKKEYVQRAERDKQRYNTEFEAFKETEQYALYLSNMANEECISKKGSNGKKESKAPKRSASSMPSKKAKKTKVESNDDEDDVATKKEDLSELSKRTEDALEVPIFTESFLALNKEREQEVKRLRRLVLDMEERNITLQRHIEELKSAITSIENDEDDHEDRLVQIQLANMRNTFVKALKSTNLADCWQEGNVTHDNIDDLTEHLHDIVVTRRRSNQVLVAKVKGVLASATFDELDVVKNEN